MIPRGLLTAFGMLQLIAPPVGAPAQRKTLLVTEARLIGKTDPNAGSLINARLAAAASRSPRFEVMTVRDLVPVAELANVRRVFDCAGDDECVSRAASACETDFVLSTTLGALGGTLVVTLSLINPRNATVVGRESVSAQGSEALAVAVEAKVSAMLGEGKPEEPFRLPSGKPISFAVFDLEPAGVPAETAKNLSEILSVELKRIEGASVIARGDLAALVSLEQMKHVVQGPCDTACLAELGGALGVDKLVVGQVGKLADTHVITLQLIDPSAVKVDNRIVESFVGEESQLIRSVRHAGRSLIGLGDLKAGTLAIAGSEVGATVHLDGRESGTLPLPPLPGLRPGRHAVRVSRSGYFDWRTDVYVDPNETTALWAQLTERPTAWYGTWWFWTIVGAAAAGGTIAVVASRAQQPGTGGGTIGIELKP